MWSKIFQPLSVAVMMLMALSFIFGPLRSVPMGVRVVTGISFGFIFYVLDQIFGPLTRSTAYRRSSARCCRAPASS